MSVLLPAGLLKEGAAPLRVPSRPCRVGHAPPRRSVQCACSRSASAAAYVSTSYQHVLLAVVDKNVYLSADTRAAVAAAGAHALSSAAKLTVLLADAEMLAGDANTRLDTVRFHLGESGYGEDPGFLTETGAKTETAIADAADSVGADLVVLSASAAHVRAVDLNLLAEFLSQPLLLIP